MSKWNNEILDVLKNRKTITVPILQTELKLSYDDAREIMASLEEDGIVTYAGGINFSVDGNQVADAGGEDSYQRKRQQLLERLRALEEEDEEEDEDENSDEDDDLDFDDFNIDETDDEDDEADTDEEDDDDIEKYIRRRRKELIERLNEIPSESEVNDEDLQDVEADEPIEVKYADDDENDPLQILLSTGEQPQQDDEEEDIDEDMSGFLSHDIMPYIPDLRFYVLTRQAYDEKRAGQQRSVPEILVRTVGSRLDSFMKFDEAKTTEEKWTKAFFTTELYLPDGVRYAPYITSNYAGEYFFNHPIIDPEDEEKLSVRREFYMLLKRHGMFFGDGTLVKQFLQLPDAMPAAIELYGALCEAKMIIVAI